LTHASKENFAFQIAYGDGTTTDVAGGAIVRAGAFFDRVVEESSKLPARVWRETLAGLMSLDLNSQLPRIQAPTLIMWGAHDGIFGRSYQDDFLRSIPKPANRLNWMRC